MLSTFKAHCSKREVNVRKQNLNFKSRLQLKNKITGNDSKNRAKNSSLTLTISEIRENSKQQTA